MYTRKPQIYAFVLITLLSLSVYGQSSSNKSYSHTYLDYPSISIGNATTFNITVHPGTLDFSNNSLKGNKARKLIGNSTDMSFFSYNNLNINADYPDINIEIAFGGFDVVNKTIKNHEIGCAMKGAELNSIENIKKNVKMCPAFYYNIEYRLPYIIKISNATGEILFIDDYEGKGWSNYGYDSTGLTGFLKTEDLETAYLKSRNSKIKREATLKIIGDANKIIYDGLFSKEVTDDFKFGTGKGRNYDYAQLSETLDKVLNAFKNEANIEETLKSAITVWENEIANIDLGNTKSRINRKVATSLYGNLTLGFMYLYQFEKSLEYSKEYVRLANMAIDQSIPERAGRIRSLVKKRSRNYNNNKEMPKVLESPAPAPDLSTLMSSKKQPQHSFVSNQNRYAAFSEEIEQQAKEEDLARNTLAGLLKKSTLENGNLVDRYRKRIQFTQLQGNTLFLNDWYDADLKGKDLPKEICELIELNELRPYGLNLKSIPEEIGNLVNLKKLDLSGNSLTSTPKSIGELKELKVLDLTNNNLETLPESIKQLKSLQRLKIKGNNFSKSYIQQLKRTLPNCKIKS